MTVLIANVDVTTDSFGQWITKTNQIAKVISNSAITVNSNTSVGNAAITGTLTANVYVTSNTGFLQIGAGTANVYANASIIKIHSDSTTNNYINESGMTLSTSTGIVQYTTTGVTLGNTSLTKSLVTSNNGLFTDILTVGNSTINIVFAGSTSKIQVLQANITTGFFSNAVSIGSGMNESNTFINRDTVRIGTLTVNTHITNQYVRTNDLYVNTITSNTITTKTLALTTNVFNIGTGFFSIANGNIGIGTGTPDHKLDVTSASLGGTSGDGVNIAKFQTNDANGTKIRFKTIRNVNGASHITSKSIIQRVVESTEMGYIGFGSQSGSLGFVDIGTGSGIDATQAPWVRINATGSLGIRKTDNSIDFGTDGYLLSSKGSALSPAWIDPSVVGFPSGTRITFNQTAAPTGWTKDTSNNNAALRVVSGSVTTGGSVNFTTAFTSQSVNGAVGATAITKAQMPVHKHTGYGVAYAADTSGYGNASTTMHNYDGDDGKVFRSAGILVHEGGEHTKKASTTSRSLGPDNYLFIDNEGSGATHTHTFTGTAINLDVKYVDVIIAQKD